MSFRAARLNYWQTWLSTTAGASGWWENSRERLKFHSALKNLRCRFFSTRLYELCKAERDDIKHCQAETEYHELWHADPDPYLLTWPWWFHPENLCLSLPEWVSTFIPLYFLVQSQRLLSRHSPFDFRHKFSPYNSSFASLALWAPLTSVKIITKEENGSKERKRN